MRTHNDIEEQAALWVLRREEPNWSASDEADLDRWLGESDSHKVAFWRLEHGWREADRVGAIGVRPSQPVRDRPAANWGAWGTFLAAAASLALIFAVFTLRPPGLPLPQKDFVETAEFATDVGRQKTVSFPDGSRVELNTATAIRAAVGEGEREVWLERGEAFFDVASRSGAEFVVHAGAETITVIGTKFSVRRADRTVTVAVLEGRVRLESDRRSNKAAPMVVSTGDLVVTDGATAIVDSGAVAAVQQHLAWRAGMLVFDDTPLAEAASEFNRYNHQHLVIRDRASAQTRIGGSFRATNVGAFAQLLEDAYGLRVDVTPQTISVSS